MFSRGPNFSTNNDALGKRGENVGRNGKNFNKKLRAARVVSHVVLSVQKTE